MRPASMALARHGVAAALALVGGAVAAGEPTTPTAGSWNFQVLLDGAPIGEHRFRLQAEGGGSKLTSEARFDVKVLGFTAYRYRHSAVERWRGDCLESLTASTDDDGKPSRVRLASRGARRVVEGSAGTLQVEGCVMSFAYWDPAMRAQTQLLNAQTGKLESVQVRPLAEQRIDVRGASVLASGFRVIGAAQPIDVWYSSEGEWIGLDSVVGDSRKLSYRLP